MFFEIASEEVYEKKAAEFGQAVEAWHSHRFRFKNLVVTGSFGKGGYTGGGTATTFTPSSFDDSSLILNGEDLPKWDSLSYRISDPPSGFLPTVKFQNIEWQETGGLRKEHGGVFMPFNLQVSGRTLITEAIPLVRATAQPMGKGLYNQCRLKKGTFLNGKCWVYSRLSRICLQIANEGSQWDFAYRMPQQNASYGCVYDGRNWTSTVYKDLDLVPTDPTNEAAEHGLNNAVMQAVVFTDLEIVVRSVHDPYLKALEITEGTLDFGMTSDEERWLGIVLLVMSVMLAVPPACALFFHCRKRSKHRMAQRPRVVRSRKQDPEMVGMKYAVGFEDEVHDVNVQ